MHFPPGPVISQSNSSDILSRVNHASVLTSTTIITLNYRLSAPSTASSTTDVFRYPQPIHDSTIAFSHILTEIAPGLVSPDPSPLQPWDPKPKPRIALTGTHIGAGLATMLALTHPNDIHSVVIADPLVDWVILDELLRPPRNPVSVPTRPRRASSPNPSQDPEAIALAAKRLIDLRTKLFPSPSAYFDPFASPTLFLRAPGRDTPRTHVEALGLLQDGTGFGEDVVEEDDGWDGNSEADGQQASRARNQETHVSGSQDQLDSEEIRSSADHDTITEAIGTDSFAFGPYDDDLSPSFSPSPSASSTPSTSSTSSQPPTPIKPKQPKRRKVLRRWPPVSNPDSVLLPHFHIFASSSSTGLSALLNLQATELADLLRRACFYGREKSFGEERVRLESAHSLQDQDQKGAQKLRGREEGSGDRRVGGGG